MQPSITTAAYVGINSSRRLHTCERFHHGAMYDCRILPGERSLGEKLRPATDKLNPAELGMLVLDAGDVTAGASNVNEMKDVPIAKPVRTVDNGSVYWFDPVTHASAVRACHDVVTQYVPPTEAVGVRSATV